MSFLNSSVVEYLLSMPKVPGSILGQVYCSCSIFHLLHMMHLLIGAKPGLLNTFFHWSINGLDWTEALLKRLTSGSVHVG